MKKRYVITLSVSLLILILLLHGMELWTAASQAEAVKIISNGFSVIGATLFCIGLLLWVDNFDGFRGFKVITYGAKKFFHYMLPFLRQNNLESSFFEYNMKRSKKKISVSHLLSIGSVYLVCSGVLAFLFEYL